MTFRDFLVTVLDVVHNLSGKHMLSGMGELLTAEQKVWVKNKLKDELLFQLELLLDMHK